MKTIIPKILQITGLLDGSITKIIVPMKVQPPAYGCTIRDGRVIIESPIGNVYSSYPIPYALNQPLIVKETWFYCDNSEFQSPSYWCYKADSNASAPANWDNIPRDERPEWARWNSPITMPRSAARMTLTPVGVRVVSVKDITEQDYPLMYGLPAIRGWYYDLQNFIKADYGQSAWEQNEWVFLYDVKTQKI